MVIVRESPRKAAPQPAQNWPPKSPLDALLSSPSGRRRYTNKLNRDSTSPSPAKRRRIHGIARTPPAGSGDEAEEENEDEDEDEDEDEETLTLKLQAIEAKLKLKKLQRTKAKSSTQNLSDNNSEASTSRPGTAASLLRPDSKQSDPGSRTGSSIRLERSKYIQQQTSNVLIPVSPVKSRAVQEPRSPARVLLGIDKGVRARDISLKRAPSTRTPGSALQASAQLTRSNSIRSVDAPRQKSFAERIAESRNNLKETAAKQERIQHSRTVGFGLDKTVSVTATAQSSFKSSDNLNVNSQPPRKNGHDITQTFPGISSNTQETIKSDSKSSKDETAPDEKSSTLEPYTGFHLSKRHMDHTALTRILQGKEIYSIPRLLKEVKSPTYEPPDCESDYVVLGIIASKSAPLDHRSGAPKTINSAGSDASARSKFMVLRLTDLKWELDLFLFGTGFETFWKMTAGTVVAVLNPGIMPPKIKDSGAFSLKLASSEDTVLEIGTAKDLRFCSAIKSDGKQCTAWLDGRKTDVCEFHIALKVDKARKGRMEFNTMVGGGGGGGGGRGRGTGRGAGRSGGGSGGRFRDDGLKPEGKQYDKYLHETMYVAPKELGFNATRLLDDQDADVNAWQRGMSRDEMQRKRRKALAQEKELALKLSALGASAGSDYLRSAHRPAGHNTAASQHQSGASSNASTPIPDPPDAHALGLIGKRAAVSSTAASKRKRAQDSGSQQQPMGWGGASKRGLLLPCSPAPLKGAQRDNDNNNMESTSPTKKKARFILANKGIREPGRESLGAAVMAEKRVVEADEDDDDDDDELEIV